MKITPSAGSRGNHAAVFIFADLNHDIWIDFQPARDTSLHTSSLCNRFSRGSNRGKAIKIITIMIITTFCPLGFKTIFLHKSKNTQDHKIK